jgi:hypothetical protein
MNILNINSKNNPNYQLAIALGFTTTQGYLGLRAGLDVIWTDNSWEASRKGVCQHCNLDERITALEELTLTALSLRKQGNIKQ